MWVWTLSHLWCAASHLLTFETMRSSTQRAWYVRCALDILKPKPKPKLAGLGATHWEACSSVNHFSWFSCVITESWRSHYGHGRFVSPTASPDHLTPTQPYRVLNLLTWVKSMRLYVLWLVTLATHGVCAHSQTNLDNNMRAHWVSLQASSSAWMSLPSDND